MFWPMGLVEYGYSFVKGGESVVYCRCRGLLMSIDVASLSAAERRNMRTKSVVKV